MKTTTRPSARRISSLSPLSFSENDPRSWVPATRSACRSSTRIFLPSVARRGEQPLGHALDHRGLAHARLAHQAGVVGAALAEDVDDLVDLPGPADDRIEPSLAGQRREVPPELGEEREGAPGPAPRAAGLGAGATTRSTARRSRAPGRVRDCRQRGNGEPAPRRRRPPARAVTPSGSRATRGRTPRGGDGRAAGPGSGPSRGPSFRGIRPLRK